MYKTLALSTDQPPSPTNGICFVNTLMWGKTGQYSSHVELEPLRQNYAAYHTQEQRYSYLSPATLDQLQLTEHNQDITGRRNYQTHDQFKIDEFSILSFYFQNGTPPHCLGIKALPDGTLQLFDHNDTHSIAQHFTTIPKTKCTYAIRTYLEKQEAVFGTLLQIILSTYTPSTQLQFA